jgi:hypothetical protein
LQQTNLNAHRMARRFLSALAVAGIVLAGIQAAQATDSIATIAGNPDQFDKKSINVRGIVTQFAEHTSRLGVAYDTFTLCADTAGACVPVFAWGRRLPITNGKTVTVYGIYYLVNHNHGYAFPNEIEAGTVY